MDREKPHEYFNPRSREGSDKQAMDAVDDMTPISIHAPAKGATEEKVSFRVSVLISIHAPAKGATPPCTIFVLHGVFQSTLPRRERHFLVRIKRRIKMISIHAPAKGATR